MLDERTKSALVSVIFFYGFTGLYTVCAYCYVPECSLMDALQLAILFRIAVTLGDSAWQKEHPQPKPERSAMKKP